MHSCSLPTLAALDINKRSVTTWRHWTQLGIFDSLKKSEAIEPKKWQQRQKQQQQLHKSLDFELVKKYPSYGRMCLD